MNIFIGIGRLTKEIELKLTTSGKTYFISPKKEKNK